MKSIRGVILLSIIQILILYNVQVETTKAERRQSVMEYMHSFFSENNNKVKQNNYDRDEKSSSKSFRFKAKHKIRKDDPAPEAKADEAAGNSTATNATGVNPGTVQRTMTPDPLMGEWFMISSKAYKDQRKFPPIILQDKKRITIETDMKDFRINNVFKTTNNEAKLPSDKFFWFRLSGLNLYYSSTETDINILGAISIDSLSTIVSTGTDASSEYITTCFSVTDHARDQWKICGLDEKTVKKWYCQIKSFLNEEDLVMCPVKDPETQIIEKVVNITQPIIIIPIPTKHCNDKWHYQNDGDDWECDCKEGSEQAPIDLPDTNQAIESAVRPLFQYETVDPSKITNSIDGLLESGKLQIQLKENLLRIFHNKFGKIVTMDGAIYYAEEIVFHTPAEHTIQGKHYDFEIQVIHYGQTQGDIAKQIVLSFLFEKAPGKYNKFLEDLNFFDLPNPISPVRDIEAKLFIPNILKISEDEYDVISMEPFSFYTYQGSLTMPPCTEDTIMYVASKPLPIGSSALQLFQEALRIPDMMDAKGNIIASDWVPKSARKIQPQNGRPVFHYDSDKYCPPTPRATKVEAGHYEKIRKAVTNYFFVSGSEPSGVPNAYVVSEDEAKGRGYAPNPKSAN